MKSTKILAAMAFMLLAVNVVYADYAYTPVQVTATPSKAFTVTLNGEAATNSDPAHPGTPTAIVWFNSSSGNEAYINPTVAGANAQVGTYPECTTPIMAIKNTGNMVETINVILNNTIASMTFDVNSSLASGSTEGTPLAGTQALTTSGLDLVTGLGPGNVTNICVWGTMTSMSGGTYYTWFNYTSS